MAEQTAERSPSWSDICEAEKPAAAPSAIPLDGPRAPVAAPSFEIDYIDPEPREICEILDKCGMVKHTRQPPEEYAHGDDTQRAIYEVYTTNPLGIKSVGGHTRTNVCFRQVSRCNYAKLIAIIYKTVRAAVGPNAPEGAELMTEANISRVDVKRFMFIYPELFGMFGTHWFGLYPLYLNAKLHIELFNHACSSKCDIMLQPYRGSDATLKQFIMEHKCAYYHDTTYAPRPQYPRREERAPRQQYPRRDDDAPQRRDAPRDRAPPQRMRIQRRRDDESREIDIASAMSQGQAMHKELAKTKPAEDKN